MYHRSREREKGKKAKARENASAVLSNNYYEGETKACEHSSSYRDVFHVAVLASAEFFDAYLPRRSASAHKSDSPH